MTTTRFARAIAPLAVIGALLITGCSPSDPEATDQTAIDTPATIETTAALGTGITSIEDLRWGSIDSDNPELNAAIEDLVLALNAESPGGLLEVNINCHWADTLGINLLTDDESGAITGEQLRAMLVKLQTWESPVEIGVITIKGFNKNFGQGDILTAATEIGVNTEFIDDAMDYRVEVPGTQVMNLLS